MIVDRILKPMVSFSVSALSDLMTQLMLWGLFYVLLAEQLKTLFGSL